VKHDSYFEEKVDGLGQPRLSSIHTIMVALRNFAISMATYAINEYMRIGESTKIK
jgi:hypothetical protein